MTTFAPNREEDLSLRSDAERVRIGLEAGWLSANQVIGWADGWIERLDEPPAVLLQISVDTKGDRYELRRLLLEVPGEAEVDRVTPALLRDLRHWMGEDPSRGMQVAKYLYSMACSGDLPDETYGYRPFGFEDGFDLAQKGFYKLSDVMGDMTTWLEAHGGKRLEMR